MLILVRRPGEMIVIDGKTTIQVLGIDGPRVRLGIEAPPSVRVNRSEIEDKLRSLEAIESPPMHEVPA